MMECIAFIQIIYIANAFCNSKFGHLSYIPMLSAQKAYIYAAEPPKTDSGMWKTQYTQYHNFISKDSIKYTVDINHKLSTGVNQIASVLLGAKRCYGLYSFMNCV